MLTTSCALQEAQSGLAYISRWVEHESFDAPLQLGLELRFESQRFALFFLELNIDAQYSEPVGSMEYLFLTSTNWLCKPINRTLFRNEHLSVRVVDRR
jgi:hypothetical protein